MEAMARRPSRRLVIALVLGAICLLAVPTLIALGVALFAVASVESGTETATATTYSSEGAELVARSVRAEDRAAGVREEWREVRRADGTWVKDGPSVRWSEEGVKLEEGAYLDGKRVGPWIFWFENGVVDPQRSGIYEDGERVEPMPGPAF